MWFIAQSLIELAVIVLGITQVLVPIFKQDLKFFWLFRKTEVAKQPEPAKTEEVIDPETIKGKATEVIKEAETIKEKAKVVGEQIEGVLKEHNDLNDKLKQV